MPKHVRGPDDYGRKIRLKERRVLEKCYLRDMREGGWPDAKIVYTDDGWPVIYCGLVDGEHCYFSRELDLYVFTIREAAPSPNAPY